VAKGENVVILSAAMRVLCLQLKRIGDAVLTAPALATLRERYPLAQITLVLHGPAGNLGPCFSHADEVLTYQPAKPNLSLWAKVVAGNWAVCYDFTGTDRSALIARMSRANQIIGYRKFAEKRSWRRDSYTELCEASVRDLSTIEFHQALVGGAATDDFGFELPARSTKTKVDDLPEGPFTVVHPGTARTEKYWIPERWAEVIEDTPGAIVLTGGFDMQEQIHLAAIKVKLSKNALSRVTDLSGRLTLLQLAAIIQQSQLVLSVDSAAMHLAAVMKKPQIALFGPTNPYQWAPRHERAIVLLAGTASAEWTPRHQPQSLDRLSTSLVTSAIQRLRQAVA
jgi:ADP-heptose:LPS heptosyltransferase